MYKKLFETLSHHGSHGLVTPYDLKKLGFKNTIKDNWWNEEYSINVDLDIKDPLTYTLIQLIEEIVSHNYEDLQEEMAMREAGEDW